MVAPGSVGGGAGGGGNSRCQHPAAGRTGYEGWVGGGGKKHGGREGGKMRAEQRLNPVANGKEIIIE